MSRTFLSFALGLIIFAAACEKAPPGILPPATRAFQAKGVVMELDLNNKSVRIRHEAIPGYMPAMTMPFAVKNSHELDQIEAGDPVSFRIIVTDTDAWIDQLRKLNAPANTNLPTRGSFRFVRDVEPFSLGDPLPDYRFTNELGQPVHLHQFRGEALAITFIFTRCPLPTFCPRLSGNFREVAEQLSKAPGAKTNWRLLTVSFDPEFDTPDRLKNYAEAYGYDPRHWNFLTGGLVDITALADQCGMTFWHDETGSLSHNLRTIVVDAQGRVQKILNGNAWTPEALANELVKGARAAP